MAKKSTKVEKPEERPILNRYEIFLIDRETPYFKSIMNEATTEELEQIAAGRMKALKVFVEQTVKRIAWRNKWTWIPRPYKVKKGNKGKAKAKK